MNIQTVQIGDLILYVQEVPSGGAHAEPTIIGEVTHLGDILDNGYVKSFVCKGRLKPVNPNALKWDHPNRWAALPPPEQWPRELQSYVATLPDDIRDRVTVARGTGGHLLIIDRATLRKAWIKRTMIESLEFLYEPDGGGFCNGAASIETSYESLVIAGKEIDLPVGFEINE